jgi:hypothetical protein
MERKLEDVLLYAVPALVLIVVLAVGYFVS